MKKTFPLTAPDREPPRVIEAIKHEVRKYVKRERRKAVPEGADFWDFACKIGLTAETAETKHIAEVNPAIDAVAQGGAGAVYVEVVAVPGHHVRHSAAPLGENPPGPAGSAPADQAPLATGLDGSATHSLQEPA